MRWFFEVYDIGGEFFPSSIVLSTMYFERWGYFGSVALAGLGCLSLEVSAQQLEVNSAASSIANGVDIASGSTVVVSDGGEIGLGVDLSNGTLIVQGGEVALGANGISTGFTNTNNEVLLTGGEVGAFFQITGGSHLTVAGGTVESFGVFNGSSADVFSGRVTRFPDIWGGAVVQIFGGELFSVRVFQTGQVHFFGSEFALDGVPIEGLEPDVARVITARDVTLSATLSDGSPFSFDMNRTAGSFGGTNPDGAASTALVTVTLVDGERSGTAVDLETEVELTGERSGVLRVASRTGSIYRLRRTTDLEARGAILAVEEGTGGELEFVFDDSATGVERAFFFVEEIVGG